MPQGEQMVEEAPVAAIAMEAYPEHEGEHEESRGEGRPDEERIAAHIEELGQFRAHPASISAKRSARILAAMRALRIRTRRRVTKKRVKPSAMMRSGQSIVPSMVEPLRRSTLAF